MTRRAQNDATVEDVAPKKKPGRKAADLAEARGPDFVGATPADMAEQEKSARAALAVMQTKVTALAKQLNYEGSTDPSVLENSARDAIRRIGSNIFELGAYLLLLKEACEHGHFLPALERLGLGPDAAQRYMAIARRFSNTATSRHLEAISTSKLVELLPLDNEQLEELTELGQTGELSLDDVATMSVKELRAAVRQARHDVDFAGEQLQKERQRADKAEKKLRAGGPELRTLEEKTSDFSQAVDGNQELAERSLVAIGDSVNALNDWWLEQMVHAPGYEPGSAVTKPGEVVSLAQKLHDNVERLAAAVGALQHRIWLSFGEDIQGGRSYVMQDPMAEAAAAETA